MDTLRRVHILYEKIHSGKNPEVEHLMQIEKNQGKPKTIKKWMFAFFKLMKMQIQLAAGSYTFLIPLVLIAISGDPLDLYPMHYKIVGFENFSWISIIINLLHQYMFMGNLFLYLLSIGCFVFMLFIHGGMMLDALYWFLKDERSHRIMTDEEHHQWIKTMVEITYQLHEFVSVLSFFCL